MEGGLRSASTPFYGEIKKNEKWNITSSTLKHFPGTLIRPLVTLILISWENIAWLHSLPGLCGCSAPVEIRQREQILQRSILLSGFPISTTLKSYHLWHIGWAYKSLLGGIQSDKSLSTPSVLVGLEMQQTGRSGWVNQQVYQVEVLLFSPPAVSCLFHCCLMPHSSWRLFVILFDTDGKK